MQAHLKSFLISLYIWTFMLVTILPLFLLYCIIWLVVLPFDRKKLVTHCFTIGWTRLYLAINPGWRIQIEGMDRIDKMKHYILISNHQSIIDIALLLQLRVNFKWVSKIELAGFPFVGWVIWMNDHILVRRGDKQSVVQMSEACKRSLSEGFSIFMFPEGTRTSDGEIKPFKEGAFVMAKDNGIPILPVVLDGASKALPRKGFWFKAGQLFTIKVLDAIPAETVNELDLQELIHHARNKMISELIAIRKYNGT